MVISFKARSGTYIEDAWKVTQGTILSPELKLQGKKNLERKTQGLEQTINYEYVINGVTYRSNSVSKESFVDPENFPEGKVVEVYYNPADATDTVLVRSGLQKQFLYVVIGFCLLIIGVVFYYLIRDLRSGR